jgi:hypothetical protein
MKYQRLFLIVVFVLLFNLATACSPASASVPTETATITPIPATSTNTPKPTHTHLPTVTPNLTATQLMDGLDALLQLFEQKGYVTTTKGRIAHLPPLDESWNQINWFSWFDVGGRLPISDFVFMAHFKWTTASTTPDPSGCGVAFGIQPNNEDYYAVFLDKSRLFFYSAQGSQVKRMSKAHGAGHISIDGDPAEADFALAVKGQIAYVSVNGDITEYALPASQPTRGRMALGLLSGTNKGYGTRCQIPDPILWVASSQ